MKERKYIKLRSDMYEDTKFKIIDTKPERDTIHYIWTRLLTLAIELNRSEEQIKLAIDVFLELEMVELIDGRIYRVKNFAKHQNIKVEEKAKTEVKEEVNEKNIEPATKSVITNEFCNKEEKSHKEGGSKDKEFENNVGENESSNIIDQNKRKADSNDSGINKGTSMRTEVSDDISHNNITIPFEKKKNKKSEVKKKQVEVVNLTEEEGEEDEMFCFREGEYIPGEGEKIIASWTF